MEDDFPRTEDGRPDFVAAAKSIQTTLRESVLCRKKTEREVVELKNTLNSVNQELSETKDSVDSLQGTIQELKAMIQAQAKKDDTP